MTHRPCGACGELVPVATGCGHWRPGRSLQRQRPPGYREEQNARKREVYRSRRQSAEDTDQVAAFARVMGAGR